MPPLFTEAPGLSRPAPAAQVPPVVPPLLRFRLLSPRLLCPRLPQLCPQLPQLYPRLPLLCPQLHQLPLLCPRLPLLCPQLPQLRLLSLRLLPHRLPLRLRLPKLGLRSRRGQLYCLKMPYKCMYTPFMLGYIIPNNCLQRYVNSPSARMNYPYRICVVEIDPGLIAGRVLSAGGVHRYPWRILPPVPIGGVYPAGYNEVETVLTAGTTTALLTCILGNFPNHRNRPIREIYG